MESLERIVELLSSFHDRASWSVKDLLAHLSVPPSSGYKLINALLDRGLLNRGQRGKIELGPAAAAFFYAPLKAVPHEPAPVLGRSGIARPERPVVSRVAQWNTSLLNLVSTERFQKKPPYVLGFANASLSNPWRVAMAGSLMAAAQRQREVSRLIVRDAVDCPTRQASQLKEMLAIGIDLCILSAASGTDPGLNALVAEMAGQGVPIIGLDRSCGGPDDLVSFVTASDVVIGRVSAMWLVEHLGGVGKVLMLCGKEDASPCQVRLQAAREVFSLHPGIEIVAVKFTDWQADIAHQLVSQHLLNKVPLDGVWSDSGLQSVGSLKAFVDAGFKKGKLPPHTGGDINLMYKMALQWHVPLCAVDYPAAMGALSFQAALDTLAGRQIPSRIETNMEVVVSRGHETASVRADMHTEQKVRWDREDQFMHGAGWIPGSLLVGKSAGMK